MSFACTLINVYGYHLQHGVVVVRGPALFVAFDWAEADFDGSFTEYPSNWHTCHIKYLKRSMATIHAYLQ